MLPRIDGAGMVLVWLCMVLDRDDFGLALRSCVIYSNPFVDHSLW
jgi:hypothetical protein